MKENNLYKCMLEIKNQKMLYSLVNSNASTIVNKQSATRERPIFLLFALRARENIW